LVVAYFLDHPAYTHKLILHRKLLTVFISLFAKNAFTLHDTAYWTAATHVLCAPL